MMRVLVTGAKGFVGKNLIESLKNIREGKDSRKKYQRLLPLEIFEYDRGSSAGDLETYCAHTDFVFNFAGVNRPQKQEEFTEDNIDFVSKLLSALDRQGNPCPVMMASSIQATLEGRFAGSEYGKSKLVGESLLREYAERTKSKVLIYRLPNLYGKWCRPNYNSAVATFCNNIALGLPITVNDSSTELNLLYIDDLVTEMLNALIGEEHYGEDGFCHAGPTEHKTLGEIVALLYGFKNARSALDVPDVTEDSFSKKLYSTYLSYLDPSDFSYPLTVNSDERGSFTEILRTQDRGQVSVNISKPGITKGQHWHHTKWEKFCVVSGEASIRMRKIGQNNQGERYPIIEHRVSGEHIEVVEMIPGYTHSITNLSNTCDLVTIMWCNELFDPQNPDTFYEEV